MIGDVSFDIEPKPDGIFVAHLSQPPLNGLELHEVLEEAAPEKVDGWLSIYAKVPLSMGKCVDQYGAVGIFEAENSWLLRAHTKQFPEAWSRVYPSTQMLRFCMEVYYSGESMGDHTFPYDWNHQNDTEVSDTEELLKLIENYDDRSGASAQDHLLARVLGLGYHDTYPREWVQLRSSAFDVPINIAVPNTVRQIHPRLLVDPVLHPKLIWKNTPDGRVPISNSEAGLETLSLPDHLEYQDGTFGLVIASLKLGLCDTWPSSHEFPEKHLPKDRVKKGEIKMEAPQVPLLAQMSAKTILNHPDFATLVGL